MDDIQPEVDYWKPSIVSFVIGANPPGKIMEGFFRRVWREHGVDKVITIKRGMFLVRFNSMENRDKVMNMDRLFFDSKPVVLKPWHLDIDVTQDEIKRIPIWVHMELNFKYWGAKCLEKIVKPVGTLIKVDNVTAQRKKLHYARCMIEVDINQKFPMAVQFLNEKNEITNVPITYEWKPEICSKCKRMGHASQQCVATNNQPKMQQKWVRKGESDEVHKSTLTKPMSQRQSEQHSQMNHDREERGNPHPDESCNNFQTEKLGENGVSRDRGLQLEPVRLIKDVNMGEGGNSFTQNG
ncbi:hypothetical protein RDABS01_015487 [Bienertia sinuspersici]